MGTLERLEGLLVLRAQVSLEGIPVVTDLINRRRLTMNLGRVHTTTVRGMEIAAHGTIPVSGPG
jgi:hypothetical protein